MSVRVFIDGSSGTTGLRIADRLAGRAEIQLLHLPESQRKELTARADAINSADLAFLCLPDAASREILPLLRPDVKVLDTSTAFRTAPGWVYGSRSCGGKSSASSSPAGWQCPAATPAASSPWHGPWWSWGWCRRGIPSAAPAYPGTAAAAKR